MHSLPIMNSIIYKSASNDNFFFWKSRWFWEETSTRNRPNCALIIDCILISRGQYLPNNHLDMKSFWSYQNILILHKEWFKNHELLTWNMTNFRYSDWEHTEYLYITQITTTSSHQQRLPEPLLSIKMISLKYLTLLYVLILNTRVVYKVFYAPGGCESLQLFVWSANWRHGNRSITKSNKTDVSRHFLTDHYKILRWRSKYLDQNYLA